MSLKAFHLFFIAISIMLCFGFGTWCVYFHYENEVIVGKSLLLSGGLLSFFMGASLVLYGVKFVQKLKNVS